MRAIPTTLLALVLLGACSNDPSGPRREPTMLGQWEVVEAELGPIAKGLFDGFANTIRFGESYVRIDEETFWAINERGLGFRGEFVAEFIAGETVDLDGQLYAVTLGNKTLRLEGVQGEILLERRESIPSVEDWIEDYVSIHVQNTAFQARGDLAWDGTDLWISGGPKGKQVIRIDSETGTAFPLDTEDLSPSALEFHDDAFYVNDGSGPIVTRVDPVTFEPSSIHMEVGSSLAHIVSDGSRLWCGSAGTQELHVLSPDPPTGLGSVAYGPGVLLQGGTYHGNELYLVANNRITIFRGLVLDGMLRGVRAVGAIQLPGHKILGAAHDGEALWVNAEDQEFDAMRLHRIVPAALVP